MVEIWLPYGSSEIPASVPDERLQDILRRQTRSSDIDIIAETRRLVKTGLADIAKRTESVCIALGASSNERVLSDAARIVLEEIRASGIPNGSITVLDTTDPQVNLPGTEQALAHDPATSPSMTLECPKLDFPVELNSALLRSDLKILVGELGPHNFLGFSGLSDIVFPGLAHANSIQSHLTNRKGKSISDLYAERIEIAGAVKNLLALGYVLDEDQLPALVAFDAFAECLGSLKDTVQSVCSCKVRKPADIVILGAGGTPIDDSLLHAVESLPAGIAAAKRDGALILAAECTKGHGGGQFYDWSTERKEPRHLEARLRHNFTYDGFKAAFLRRTIETHRVHLVSTIADYYVERIFGMRPAQTVNSALQTAQRAMGSDASITVIPNAARVIPTSYTNN